MLVRHLFSYLIAKGLPGLLSFAAIALYTRLLSEADFGRYSSTMAMIGLVHVIAFQWLLLVLGRFLPANLNSSGQILAPILSIFLIVASAVVVCGGVLCWLFLEPNLRQLMLFAIVLSISQAWHELNLRLASARLLPSRYGMLSGAKAVTSLIVGTCLAFLGVGASAPIIGLAAGSVIAYFFIARSDWKGIKPAWPRSNDLKEYLSYGLPLAITFALVWVTASSDRLMITWLLGEASTGIYAVGYDLAQQSLGLVLIIINTASMPIAIRKMEQHGPEAAGEQMRQNGALIFCFAFSGAAVLIATAPALIDVFVGPLFRQGALTVFPWVAILAAVVGIKSFHFDLAFHLTKRSRSLIVTSGVAAILNVCLNLILIPRYGILGAAWAGIASYLSAAICSGILGARIFLMPRLPPIFFAAISVAGATFVGSWLAMHLPISPILRVFSSLFFGGVFFSLSMFFLNVADVRKKYLKSRPD